MRNVLIKAENISKRYRLGTLNANTVKEDIRLWLKKKSFAPASNDENISSKYIWALRNIDFEVEQGEVMGLIGKNGAGKSTLLKIISRIILPTTGSIRGKGRSSSLLEVGTGFHRELTGRENIYLNGHVLGMKKKEIEKKFDEIVDFSGVAQFLDTPVKRYSSGMYVRLAFAVAAHLDPEILILDEVLAVGDAAFQKKCIDKMREVSSKKGKTILFVSHNMNSLRNLCQRVMALDKGEITEIGKPETVIASYLKNTQRQQWKREFMDPWKAPGNASIRIKEIVLAPEWVGGGMVLDTRTPLHLSVEFWYQGQEPDQLGICLRLFNATDDCVFEIRSSSAHHKSGWIRATCTIPGHFLNDGAYYISIIFLKNVIGTLFQYESCLSFEVEDYRGDEGWHGKRMGIVRPDFPLRLHEVVQLPNNQSSSAGNGKLIKYP
jgi:lipopolysaccharide transport system ATP-binding protein